jgi:hypothetical protein
MDVTTTVSNGRGRQARRSANEELESKQQARQRETGESNAEELAKRSACSVVTDRRQDALL